MTPEAIAIEQAERWPWPDYATAWLSAQRWAGKLPPALLRRRVRLDLVGQHRDDTRSRRVGFAPFVRLERERDLRAPGQWDEVTWRDLLAALPCDEYRRVIDLRYREGWSLEDLAFREFGVSPTTVRRMHDRALQILRHRLSERA